MQGSLRVVVLAALLAAVAAQTCSLTLDCPSVSQVCGGTGGTAGLSSGSCVLSSTITTTSVGNSCIQDAECGSFDYCDVTGTCQFSINLNNACSRDWECGSGSWCAASGCQLVDTFPCSMSNSHSCDALFPCDSSNSQCDGNFGQNLNAAVATGLATVTIIIIIVVVVVPLCVIFWCVYCCWWVPRRTAMVMAAATMATQPMVVQQMGPGQPQVGAMMVQQPGGQVMMVKAA